MRKPEEPPTKGADLSTADGPAKLLAQIDPAFGGRFAGRLDILVNNAGPIDTELSPADGPRADILKKLTSVGRYGKVEEIASAVSFLGNPEQAFINGESLMVDGGWNA